MQTLITASGFTMVPPSGLAIVTNSVQLAVTASGNIRVSGSLGTLNNLFYNAGELMPMEVHFLLQENVTVTPSAGSAIVNYVYAGSPEIASYYKSVTAYSEASGVQRWAVTTPLSGSYAKGFGG